MGQKENNELRQGKSPEQQETSEMLAAAGIIGILLVLTILIIVKIFS